MRHAISALLFLAKICGKVVGFHARAQTRFLTWAQDVGWEPSDKQFSDLMRRQQQLAAYQVAKKQMKLLKHKTS